MISSQQEQLILVSDPKNVAQVETFVEKVAKNMPLARTSMVIS